MAWSHGLFLLSGPAGIGRWRIQPTACGKFYALILSDPVCEFGWNQDGMDMCPILIRTLQTLSSDGKLLSLSLILSLNSIADPPPPPRHGPRGRGHAQEVVLQIRERDREVDVRNRMESSQGLASHKRSKTGNKPSEMLNKQSRRAAAAICH